MRQMQLRYCGNLSSFNIFALATLFDTPALRRSSLFVPTKSSHKVVRIYRLQALGICKPGSMTWGSLITCLRFPAVRLEAPRPLHPQIRGLQRRHQWWSGPLSEGHGQEGPRVPARITPALAANVELQVPVPPPIRPRLV